MPPSSTVATRQSSLGVKVSDQQTRPRLQRLHSLTDLSPNHQTFSSTILEPNQVRGLPSRMKICGFWISWTVLSLWASSAAASISCHECGHMYDGASFMAIQDFKECQFFEHDINENDNRYLQQCPEHDSCCFSLREYMSIEFWGHAAAAEVFLHGCCSSLNRTGHHLASPEPPALVTSSFYKAEIMSQTVQNGHIKTRVLFCNTLGCNNQRVPWSEPVQPDQQTSSTTDKGPLKSGRNGRRTDATFIRSDLDNDDMLSQESSRGPSLTAEDYKILSLLEGSGVLDGDHAITKGATVSTSDSSADLIKEDLFREFALRMGLPLPKAFLNSTRSRLTADSTRPSRTVCECQCTCPALVCPSFNAAPVHRPNILQQLLLLCVLLALRRRGSVGRHTVFSP